MVRRLATEADLRAIESEGFDAYLPHRSPYALIRATAHAHAHRTAIRYLNNVGDPAGDTVLTYDQLLTRIHQAARLFRRLGCTDGAAVGILAPNSPAAQVALWGAQLAGCACPINPMLKPAHIAELLRSAHAAVLVVLGENSEVSIWQDLVPGLREAGIDLPILHCESSAPTPGSDGCFEALCAAESADPPGFGHDGDPDAIAALYHTGGTTGLPKLVRHTRENEAHVGRSAAMMYALSPDDILVNGFPLFHVAGAFVYGLSVFSVGGCLLIPGRLGMRNAAFMGSIWQQIEHYQVTIVGGVPTVLSAMIGQAVNADIGSLRLMLTGGSPLPTELAEAFERHTAKPVRNILGMTESAGCIAIEPYHGQRTPNSCGLRLPFTQLRIITSASGPADGGDAMIDAPLGETGILAVRGPNISPGYTNHDLGRGTFVGEHWLLSGDLGHLDDTGRVFITGREKDVIIRGAHNLDPQMIEAALLSHSAVADAAAVGMPDSYAGELPVAFVTLRSEGAALPRELLDHIRPRIDEPAALPKRIEIIETMPLTPVGKIFKPALRQEATRWAIMERARAEGIADDALQIEFDSAMQCHLCATVDILERLRQALVGMPLQIRYKPRQA